jgi:hypothetical protein
MLTLVPDHHRSPVCTPASPPPPEAETTPSPLGELSCQRDLFSLPPQTHYLNCAYMAPLSRAVEQAGIAGLRRKRYPVEIPPADFFRGPDALRQAFARLIHTDDARRIAILPSVSYAMAMATRNVSATRGQNVVVIGREFPSAVLPWRR